MTADLKTGDVVELMSGSPEMTVEVVGKDISGREFVSCAWFHGMEKKTANFPPDALKKIKATS